MLDSTDRKSRITYSVNRTMAVAVTMLSGLIWSLRVSRSCRKRTTRVWLLEVFPRQQGKQMTAWRLFGHAGVGHHEPVALGVFDHE